MRVLLQRVTYGAVRVAGETIGQVHRGFVALVGITHADTPAVASAMAHKVAHLRVFDDDEGRMNRSALDVGAGILVISQFTLYADMRRGRRPDFLQAARPETAQPLVEAFVSALRAHGIAAETGRFGALMHVEIHNDGPVTLWLDSDELVK
jgi:D-tyrosyl-tRNA(Tyr) deacylase